MYTGIPILQQMNENVKISQLIGKKSWLIFKLFNINYEWLYINSTKWNGNIIYNEAVNKLKELKVSNDLSERAIKLITDFNSSITKNET